MRLRVSVTPLSIPWVLHEALNGSQQHLLYSSNALKRLLTFSSYIDFFLSSFLSLLSFDGVSFLFSPVSGLNEPNTDISQWQEFFCAMLSNASNRTINRVKRVTKNGLYMYLFVCF